MKDEGLGMKRMQRLEGMVQRPRKAEPMIAAP
jgi:hypothetical protein